MEQLELGLDAVTPDQWDKIAKKSSLITKEEATDSWDLYKHGDIKKQVYKKSNEDEVNKPPHYNTGSIETMDYIIDVLGKHEAAAYCHGNIIKYTGTRLWNKGNPIQDAKKARWYLDKLITLLEETQGETW